MRRERGVRTVSDRRKRDWWVRGLRRTCSLVGGGAKGAVTATPGRATLGSEVEAGSKGTWAESLSLNPPCGVSSGGNTDQKLCGVCTFWAGGVPSEQMQRACLRAVLAGGGDREHPVGSCCAHHDPLVGSERPGPEDGDFVVSAAKPPPYEIRTAASREHFGARGRVTIVAQWLFPLVPRAADERWRPHLRRRETNARSSIRKSSGTSWRSDGGDVSNRKKRTLAESSVSTSRQRRRDRAAPGLENERSLAPLCHALFCQHNKRRMQVCRPVSLECVQWNQCGTLHIPHRCSAETSS